VSHYRPDDRTKRRGRVVNTPTSYSGGPGFDYRSRRPAILIEVFRGFPQSLQANAERRGRVVNTPTSYSGGPGFDSRSRRPAMLIEVFRGFPQSLQANAGIVP
jgi:hypothetical protein